MEAVAAPPPRGFWADNALSIVLLACFLLFWLTQALTGWAVHNGELHELHQHALSFGRYLTTAHFWSSTAENWESEFLQMAAFVVLTVYLKQRGSAESCPYPDEQTPEQKQQEARDEQVKGFWQRNSLSVALFGLFAVSCGLHLFNSFRNFNHDQLARVVPQNGVEYVQAAF